MGSGMEKAADSVSRANEMAGESDESILGGQREQRRSDGVRGMAIVRTTEVSVTR